MTVKKLRKMLENIPDDAEILMHLEARGGRAFETYMGRYIAVEENVSEEVLEELRIPYDGNCLIKDKARTPQGVFVISDWKI